jgi:hypothetical protein
MKHRKNLLSAMDSHLIQMRYELRLRDLNMGTNLEDT